MKYSVVIPVFNEQDSLASLLNSLKIILDSLCAEFEVIFVNDGSTDDTASKLNELARLNPCVRTIGFRQNLGQGKAIEEGLRNAKGQILITMDADLQNDPADIPVLISRMDEGFDLVCGWRYNRKDSFLKRLKSRIGNFLQRLITGIPVHDMSCTFRAYRRNILEGIAFEGKYDFSLLPYIIYRKHRARITEVKVTHRERRFGATKYKFWETVGGTVVSYFKLVLSS
jgi:glycosyltransferase involved in cell wall biosynthesis